MATLDFVLLSNATLVHQGVLSILGAGTAGTTVAVFPAQIPLSIATRIMWDSEDVGRIHEIRVIAHHYDGEPIADVRFPVATGDPPPGLPVASVIGVPIALLVRRVGVYQVEFHLDGILQKTMEHVVVSLQANA